MFSVLVITRTPLLNSGFELESLVSICLWTSHGGIAGIRFEIWFEDSCGVLVLVF